MNSDWIIKEAQKIEEKIISHRRALHQLAEVGFSLEKTFNYVFNVLSAIGCKPQKCGRKGIVVKIVGEKSEHAFRPSVLSTNLDDYNIEKVTKNAHLRSILLRADMDALQMAEEGCLPFKSENGCMHSCGHDMHTAMLLGACEILFFNKENFSNVITLMFQPAEETLEGAKDMIENGLLDEGKFDYAAMLHVITGTDLETGTLILSNSETIAPCADFYKIEVIGKGAHGAMPSKAVDPILIGAHILLSLEELVTRELSGVNGTAITVGEFKGGTAPNVIPEKVQISGTSRTYDENARNLIIKRMSEIAEAQASVFNGYASTLFESGCPAFKNNVHLAKSAYTCLKDVDFSHLSNVSPFNVILQNPSKSNASLASEDFSYVSQKIPSILIALSAGKNGDGYTHPLHTPKTAFDERALLYGTIAYATLGAKLK